jgi:hypothetical protein
LCHVISSSSVFTHWTLCVSMWLGTSEAQWLRLWPESETRVRGDSTLVERSQGVRLLGSVSSKYSTHHSAFDIPVELHWWTQMNKTTVIRPGLEPGIIWSWAECPSHLTTDLHKSCNCMYSHFEIWCLIQPKVMFFIHGYNDPIRLSSEVCNSV